MVLELTRKDWKNEIEEKGKKLSLSSAEIEKVRRALSDAVESSKFNPRMSSQEFNDLADKIMCVRFDDEETFILNYNKGRLTLSLGA